jgi:hypothetical protein
MTAMPRGQKEKIYKGLGKNFSAEKFLSVGNGDGE